MSTLLLDRIFRGRHLNQIVRGSSLNTVAKFGGMVLGFLGSILIGKYYGADMLGRIATLSSLFSILAIIAALGNQTYLLKLIPQQIELYGYYSARHAYRRVMGIVLAFTVLVLLAYKFSALLGAPWHLPTIDQYEWLMYGLVIVTVIKRLNVKALRALGDYKVFSLMELLPALMMLVAAGIGVALHMTESPFLYLYYAPHFLIIILSSWVVTRLFRRGMDQEPTRRQTVAPGTVEILAVSLPMFGVTISNSLISSVDILMINHYSGEALTGIYSVYTKVIAVPAIVTTAINAMFAPKISALHAKQRHSELRRLTQQTTLLAFGVTLIAAVFALLLHRPFFALYGERFNDYLPAFYWLLCGTLLNSFFGSVGFFLSMTGQHTAFFQIMLSAAFLNIVLNAWLIPLMGMQGAALATLITVALWNLLAVIVMKRGVGYTSLFLPYLAQRIRK